jgi:GNAT superfamily N-acetyltransferase
MGRASTEGGVAYDPAVLDAVERRFWREIWTSVPEELARERGIEVRRFGPVQASVLADLPGVPMFNLLLGAAEPGAVSGGHLAAAVEWAGSRGARAQVPVTPGLAESEAAPAWLAANGFLAGHPWMKFVRDTHPPRFPPPGGVEVVRVGGEEEPFAMVAASGFGMPAWAAAFFARLPLKPDWRCYVARIDGTTQACAAMLLDGEVAELGAAATLEAGRRRGCQLALLRQRILDAAEAGCRLLFVETGARVGDRPASSYRNVLRAGFEEAYLRPNWVGPEAGTGLS